MGDFSADWLTLREPADARSRDSGLMELLAAWARGRSALTVVDLGCGTGANLRALGPFLGSAQRWTAVDRDPALLARLPGRAGGGGWSAEVTAQQRDLTAFDWPEAELITASALLDLVSREWLARLVERHRGSAFHFALTIDGRIDLTPDHPADAAILASFGRDLARPKGLGPALGGAATAEAENLLQQEGHRVAVASSDWKLGSDDGPLVKAWLLGIAEADLVRAENEEKILIDWLKTRIAQQDAGELMVRVGHRDLLALPL